jgi:hypothetical protein
LKELGEENNVQMNFKEMVCEDMDSDSGNGAVAVCCENGSVPSGCIKGGKYLDYLSIRYPLKKCSPS